MKICMFTNTYLPHVGGVAKSVSAFTEDLRQMSIARLIRKRGVLSPVKEIPTGVDTEFFANGRREQFQEEFRIPRDAFVIGHLGRLAPEKNLIFLSKAISGVMGDLPDSKFLVVGKGPSEKEIIHTFNTWENLLVGIQTEWDMISGKVKAVVKTIGDHQDEAHVNG